MHERPGATSSPRASRCKHLFRQWRNHVQRGDRLTTGADASLALRHFSRRVITAADAASRATLGDMDGPRVVGSVEALVAGASHRTSIDTLDGKSGASFERIVINAERFFLKRLSAADDWIMRCTGNMTHGEYRVWEAGLYHRVPPVIDHTVVAMALEGDAPTARLAILMHDCTDDLVPPGDGQLSVEQHDRFIEHLARFHATFFGWHDTIGLQRLEQRLLWFAPATIAPELDVPSVPDALAAAARGWQQLRLRSPQLDDLIRRVHHDPAPSQALSGAHRRRSSPATGSSAISALDPTAERSFSIGRTQGRHRRVGSWSGTSP